MVTTHEIWPDLKKCLGPLIREFTDDRGRTRQDGIDALVDPKYVAVDADGDALTVDGEALTIGGVSFQFHHTPHVHNEDEGIPNRALDCIWGESGVEMYFTSDTQFRSDIAERYPNSSCIFHDCTFIKPSKVACIRTTPS